IVALSPGAAAKTLHLYVVLPPLPQKQGAAARHQANGLSWRRGDAREADSVRLTRGRDAGDSRGAHAWPIEDEDAAHHSRPSSADDALALAAHDRRLQTCRDEPTSTLARDARMSIVPVPPTLLPLPSDQDATGRTLGDEEIAALTEAIRS